MNPIYLDYNATTTVHPGVVAAMTQHLRGSFGNPSSTHWCGAQARSELAGEQTLGWLLNAFTPSGTERFPEELWNKGIQAARPYGRFTAPGTGRIRVFS